MTYNSYLVTFKGVALRFNSLQKAVDFIRTMMTAEGELVVEMTKEEKQEGDEM